MSKADFIKRLQQAEVPVKSGLFEQVLAGRAKKKSQRIWFAGAGVSVLFLLVLSLFRQTDGINNTKQDFLHESKEGQVSVSGNQEISGQSQEDKKAAVAEQGEVPQTERNAGLNSSLTENYVSDSYGHPEGNFEAPEIVADAGWTVYPPLSALGKPLNVAEAEQIKPLEAKWFGLIPARFRKPDPASKSPVHTGFKPLHNDWLLEVLANPALMQMHSGNTEYNKLLNRTEHQQTAMQAVFRAGRQFSNNLRWFAGLKWSEQHSRFDYMQTTTHSTTVVDVKQLTIKEPGMPDRQITVHDTSTLNSLVNSSYSATNRLRSFGIPLGLQFSPAGKSGSLYLFGSLTPSYVLNTRGMRILPNGHVLYMVESARIIRRFQFTTELGLGLRKTLAQGLFLTLEPRISYDLLSLNRVVSQHGIHAGMSVGISFRPGR